jgi:hypothetical protein
MWRIYRTVTFSSKPPPTPVPFCGRVLFADGNRRTALAAALVFLEINGVVDHNYNESVLLQAMLYLAEDKMDGKLFAQFLREAVSGITGTWEDESQDR